MPPKKPTPKETPEMATTTTPTTATDSPEPNENATAEAPSDDAVAAPEAASIRDGLASLNIAAAERMHEQRGADPDVEKDVDKIMEDWKDQASAAEMEVYRPALFPSAPVWQQMRMMAEDLATAASMPVALYKKPADVALVLLVGRDIGIKATTAINCIHIIKGRPTIAANLMRALIKDAGHDIWFEEVSRTSATICAHRKEWPVERVSRVTWTLEDAQTAELVKSFDPVTGKVVAADGKNPWRQYPRAMLKARATSEVARDDFSDVLLGVSYTPEEMGADVDESGEPLKVQSSSWSENSPDAPAYEPAPQIVLDAFIKEVDSLSPAEQEALKGKWSELKLRPLRPTQHFPQTLAVDEVGLLSTAIAEVRRDTPAEAEVVSPEGNPAPGPGGAEAAAEREEEPATADGADTVRIPVERATEQVERLAGSQVRELLESFEDVAVPASEAMQRKLAVELIASQVLCVTCGGLREGAAFTGQAHCGCVTA